MNNELVETIWRITLTNALQHDGHARVEPVLGKLLAEKPELKGNVKQIMKMVTSLVKKANRLTTDKQKQTLKLNWPNLSIEKPITEKEKKQLPILPNVEKYSFIHMRFCPNPDGALHLGGCRAAILDDEYAKMYKGRFTLRFDDTDPRTKSPILEAYDWIREDLEWLGVRWHREVYQSDRIEVYYSYTERLIELGGAYICTCEPERFRRRIISNKKCPCRDLPSEEHLDRWSKMCEGKYAEREAVVRIKTDLNHPNPAVRDWPALRIIDVEKYPHPRVGKKYIVWPLFALCCGIDDYELEVSHILRGKEHLTNSERARFLYKYLGWEEPDAIHYGRLKMSGTVLSKSKIRDGIARGLYSNWDDPRLGTLKALRRRGFLPETIRNFILSVGPKPVDVTVSWPALESINRKLIDQLANRCFFVSNPIELIIDNVRKNYVCKQPRHPDHPERGSRTLKVSRRDKTLILHISKNDLKLFKNNRVIRLMGLFNIKVKKKKNSFKAEFHSDSYRKAKEMNAPLIHWLPLSNGIQTSVIMPDSTRVDGLAEDQCKPLEPYQIIQFERFGFARIDKVNDHLIAYYTHR